jgi:hypothetical protein
MTLTYSLPSLELRPRADCTVCKGTGWVCEEHEVPIPHDQCRGPEIPCKSPGCLSDWFSSQGLD